jgi:hypothetical protein
VSERSNELARRFNEANGELIATIEGCSDEQLQAATPEGWSVLMCGYHVAASMPDQLRWLPEVAAGHDVPFTWNDINRRNEQQMALQPELTRDKTLALLRENGAAFAAAVRALDDAQLATSALIDFAGSKALTADQFVKWVSIFHIKDHLKSIRAAISA